MSSKKGFILAAAVIGCSALAAGTTAAFAAANANGSESRPSDARISQEVQHKLQRDLPNLYNLQVETKDGVVTLSGRADTPLTEQKALVDARDIKGVTHVKNHLKVTM